MGHCARRQRGAKNTFALHFLLEYPKSLVDVVVANDYLQETFLSDLCSNAMATPFRAERS
jgi:hypothetical protein